MSNSKSDTQKRERFESKFKEGQEKFRLIREGRWSAVRSPKTVFVLRSGEQLSTKVTL